jgi:hypothetical protein
MTLQSVDRIIIKGKKYPLDSYPLEDYWTEENPRPPKGIPGTSWYRGYKATWEIIDDYLYLTDIVYRAPYGDKGLEYVFPNSPEKKILADWYSGELKVHLGDWISDDPKTNTAVFESDLFIRIEKGKVVSQRYKANY